MDAILRDHALLILAILHYERLYECSLHHTNAHA
jgi:hypothetical protein